MSKRYMKHDGIRGKRIGAKRCPGVRIRRVEAEDLGAHNFDVMRIRGRSNLSCRASQADKAALREKAVIAAGLSATHVGRRGQYSNSSPVVSQTPVMIPGTPGRGRG
jgi:hypothetical protein